MPATILVVDDQAPIRGFLEEILKNQGYAVLTANDGQEALRSFANHRPDLVLLDVSMPHLDGIQVCRELKQSAQTRLTPVVLITGHSALGDRVRGLEAGADDLLTKPIDRSELMARVRALLNLKAFTDELDHVESVLFALARSIEGKDSYTGGHCDRLSDYSERLGRRIGLPEEQITALRQGGIVHDIGKVAVPDSILLKPGKLTPEEWKVMREHPVSGERICAPMKLLRPVLPIIRHHHEKLDGTGYPDGLKGEEIPLLARIMTITDVYDALSTDRSYHTALPSWEALEVMEQDAQRGWWDNALFTEFKAMFPNNARTDLRREGN
jgi:putative two-component system response regulator